MTREEAKQMIESMGKYLSEGNPIWGKEPVKEATRMAIEALKTEPIRCGECENYIDRRCIEANHHVAAHGNCMKVFGAKRREL